MKTRTLLLLAVSCGLVILLAGSLQLLRLSNQHSDAALPIGSSAKAGDAAVTVVDFQESAGVAMITVRLSGVDDATGLDGFRLQTIGALVAPNQRDAHACAGFTVAAVTCTLTFGTGDAKGASRQLIFRRAEQQVRWKLV